jgi:N utilization substance protein B
MTRNDPQTWITFSDTPEYLAYIQQPDPGLEQEKEVNPGPDPQLLVESDNSSVFFEERNILWIDDYDTALLLVMKTIKGYNAGVDLSLLSLSSDEEIDEMKDFILPLFRKTILHGDKYEAIIAKHAENWEFDRIAMVDVLLMKMAICELIHFPSIPIKVTINEYIEISKEYSTNKSKVYINGMPG